MQNSQVDFDYLHLDHPDIAALVQILNRDGNKSHKLNLLVGTVYADSFQTFVSRMTSWLEYVEHLVKNAASGFVHKDKVHVELNKLGFVTDTAIGKAEFSGLIICCGPYIALRCREG